MLLSLCYTTQTTLIINFSPTFGIVLKTMYIEEICLKIENFVR